MTGDLAITIRHLLTLEPTIFLFVPSSWCNMHLATCTLGTISRRPAPLTQLSRSAHIFMNSQLHVSIHWFIHSSDVLLSIGVSLRRDPQIMQEVCNTAITRKLWSFPGLVVRFPIFLPRGATLLRCVICLACCNMGLQVWKWKPVEFWLMMMGLNSSAWVMNHLKIPSKILDNHFNNPIWIKEFQLKKNQKE